MTETLMGSRISVTSLRERAVAFLPPGSSGRKLTLLALVDAIGTGSFLSVSVVFLTRVVGLSVSQVGLGLGLSAVVSLVSSVPLGFVADRYGVRTVLVIAYLWRAAGFAVYAFVANFAWFLIVVIGLAVLDKVLGPLAQALVGMSVVEDQRVRTMAVMGAVRNVGFGIGSLLGGAALIFDTRAAYASVILLNASTFVIMAVITLRLRVARSRQGRIAGSRSLSKGVFTNRPYLMLAGLNAVLSLHMALLGVAIPIWVTTQSSVPTAFISVLLLTNTVIAVLFQVRVSRGADTALGAARLLRIAGLSLAVCCCLLVLVPSVPVPVAMAVLLAGIVSLTMGEMYQSAGAWGVSYRLAPQGSESSYLTLFWLGAGIQQVAAPLLIAVVVNTGALTWIAVAIGIALAGVAVPPVTTWALGWAETEPEAARPAYPAPPAPSTSVAAPGQPDPRTRPAPSDT